MTDPLDDTQPHAGPGPAATSGPPDPAIPTGAPATPREPVPATPPPLSGPVLTADPNRPADSGWREPAWFPPRDRDRRDRRPSGVALLVGFILIGLGVYWFVDRTLGIDLPRIQWSSVWPVILILVGGLILIRSFQRRA